MFPKVKKCTRKHDWAEDKYDSFSCKICGTRLTRQQFLSMQELQRKRIAALNKSRQNQTK